MTRRFVFLLLTISLLLIFFISWNKAEKEVLEKINGANLVSPPKPITKTALQPLKDIHTDWVSIIPYAFIDPEEPTVRFDFPHQWWGERTNGSSQMIEMAREEGFKIMLKPHVWIRGQGWAGDFLPKATDDWPKWEESYAAYILTYAKIAAAYNVELFCIGTEFRKTTVERPDYWIELIKKVRQIYKGKVTYAANWDNYENIVFWDELDFIGIDAYFPLCEQKTPSLKSLTTGWKKVSRQLNDLSSRYDRPILFTEYGYESVDYTADGHWKHNRDTLLINDTAQMNAYKGLYDCIWPEPWFKGGFFWKWHLTTPYRPERLARTFTPQNKPVLDVIKKYYKDEIQGIDGK